MMAELYAPIPETAMLSSSPHLSLTELEFSCNQVVQYNRHDAIGSGKLLNGIRGKDNRIYTSFFMRILSL